MTVKLLAVCVASVTASVYFVPLLVTDVVILSPDLTVSPATCTAPGYISHQE